MPGHSGYDPGTARRRLSAISYSKNTEDAALARIRLTEISNGSASDDCRSEVHDLQQRLDKIVDIERTLDRTGNDAKSDPRSEERRGGKECVSTCISRMSRHQ